MNNFLTQRNIRQTLKLVQDIERRIIVISFFMLITFAVLYLYFIASAVLTTVMHKEIRANIVSLNTEVADLEANYLKSKNTISYSLALEKGFVPISHKTFFKRSVYVGRAY